MPHGKRCTRCKVYRPEGEFPRSNSKTDGLGSWCNGCQTAYRVENRDHIRAYQREYRRQNPRTDYQRRYQQENAQRLSVYNREYREQNAERIAELNRARALMKRYGTTVEQYEAKLAAQDGLCAICGRPEPTKGRRLAQDHDRACCPGRKSCGECLRDLLCTWCNNRLSALEDERWRTAADAYLDRHRR